MACTSGCDGAGLRRELVFEFVAIGEEPDGVAAVRFADEVAQSVALRKEISEVAEDDNPEAVVSELLQDLAGKACAQREEGGVERGGGDNDKGGVTRQGLANQVDGILNGAEDWCVLGVPEDSLAR